MLETTSTSLTPSPSTTRSALALTTFSTLVTAAAVAGRATTEQGQGVWYRTLSKPSFQPPAWIFGPVWTLLYGTIAYSGWQVWKQPPSRERTRALTLWGAQWALNAAWTPLFFGLHRPRAALVDIVALTGAIVGYADASRRVSRSASRWILPYLGWTLFATALNTAIVRRNR
jgi:translocator protein